jgi:hypothetical protein
MRVSLVRGVIAVAVGLGAVAALVAPASAHDRQEPLFRGGALMIQLGHGGVNMNHGHVWVCDDRSDGLGVRLYYRLYNGVTDFISDTNGSQSGCGGGFPSSSEVKEFMLTAGPNPSDPAQYATPWYQS